MWWGRHLEGVVFKRYAASCPPELTAFRCYDTEAHPTIPWMLASPDGFLKHVGNLSPRLWGIEAKTAGSKVQAARWGGVKAPLPPTRGGRGARAEWRALCEMVAANNADQVPEEYLIQAAWCMAVCDLPRWDIAVLLATYRGLEYRQYKLMRDRELEDRLMDIGQEFLAEHVARRIPPPPEGTASSHRALRALYPVDEEPIAPANEDMTALAMDLKLAEESKAEATAEYELLKQQIKAAVKGAAGVEGAFGSITWRANVKGVRTFRAHWT
jgi:hypothetical protein